MLVFTPLLTIALGGNKVAKINKTRLKKRKQRHLKKAFKYSENHSEKVTLNEAQKLLLQNTYLPPYKEPKEDTNKKHEERNKLYQSALDKVYGGTVIPLVNYTNPRCTILHKCTECGREFFSKPGWIITKENQKHICGVDTGKNETEKNYRKGISEVEKLELCKQAKKGVSVSRLVKQFDISRYMANKYLKEAGLK